MRVFLAGQPFDIGSWGIKPAATVPDGRDNRMIWLRTPCV